MTDLRFGTSYITVACTSAKRWFDLDAVRGDYRPQDIATRTVTGHDTVRTNPGQDRYYSDGNPAGAPPLDWWDDDWHTVRTRLITMMCPRQVCITCGRPSERIVSDKSAFEFQPALAAHIKERREALGITSAEINGWFGYKEIAKNWERTDKHGAAVPNANDWAVLRERLNLDPEWDAVVLGERRWTESTTEYINQQPNGDAVAKGRKIESPAHALRADAVRSDLGWSDCGHNNWRPGVAYDPFTTDGDPMTTKLLVGDVRTRIREIPDGTVDLIVTSPPFLALRKYGDNDAEMGSEGTPADFLDALLELTAGEFRRVLAPHGSIAIELGDTYSGSGGAGGDYSDDGLREGQPKFRQARVSPDYRLKPGAKTQAAGGGEVIISGGAGWPLSKSLALIPQLYPASLAYGRNLLRPEHTFAPWRVRNIITWCRPNPPVGALGDKVRTGTTHITVACTSAKRWFDLDAVRNAEPSANTHAKLAKGASPRPNSGKPAADGRGGNWSTLPVTESGGAPPLDWCDDTLDPDDPTDHMSIVMPTQPYPGAHYATWPAKLAQRLIDMMCPRQVCTTCGRPRERIVESERTMLGKMDPAWKMARSAVTGGGPMAQSVDISRTTLGWSDCGHNNWRPGHVLDPFAGSGTTLAVAMGMGRDATGIELYPANADLIRDRVGMFLEELDPHPIVDTRPL